MALRASWKGFLRISLVTCPVALYPATSSSARVSFNRINRKTGARVRQMNVDGRTGEKVESEDIVRGYEIDKDHYVLVEDDEIEAIQVEGNKVINVGRFVEEDEVDPVYYDASYYIAPEGDVGKETFQVIQTALEDTGTAGIGTIVLSSRERRVILRPKGKGIFMTTLRTAKEIRGDEGLYDDLGDEPLDKELISAAKMLIEQKRQEFDSAELVDQYEEALVKLIKAKAKGEKPVFAPVAATEKVVDLMAALKKSLAEGGATKPPSRQGRQAAAAKPAKPAAKAKTAQVPAKAKRRKTA
jgi:DNA end-binding protein Ku